MSCNKWISSSLFFSALISQCNIEATTLTPPASTNAGIIEKQIQKEYQVEEMSPTKEIPLLDVDIPDKTLNVPMGISVEISSVEFAGNTAISDRKLQTIVKPYLGRQLNGHDVQEMCLTVQQYYVQQGYLLARVFPPVQDIGSHRLIIEVMEGVLGRVEVQGNHHYSTKYLEKAFERYRGNPINYNELLRALLLLNENMDLSVGSIFKKGKEKGEVDLVVVVKDKLPLHIYSDYNNYGSDSSTKHRVGTRVDYGNLIAGGDKVSIVEVIGQPVDHLNYTNLVYSVPVNTNGLRFELAGLASYYKSPRLGELDLHGNSWMGWARLSQALYRTRRLSTDAYLEFDYDQFKNYEEHHVSSFDKLRVLILGGKIDYIDTLKGRNIIDLSISGGIPNFLGGLHAVDPRCSREGGGGRFFIANMDYRRLQQLPMSSLLIFNAVGQGTLNKLPISEQFYIGGIDTVRGYPLATALGDNGYYGNLELRIPPPFLRHKKVFRSHRELKDIVQIVGFVDHGGVFLNKHQKGEDAPVYLTSAGAGLRLYNLWRFDVNFDAGFPLTKDHRSSDTILYFRLGLNIY